MPKRCIIPLLSYDADKDTGRCCADNVWAGNPGAEFWGVRPVKSVLDKNGKTIANLSPSMNFLIYWDSDLEREMLSGTMISKMKSATQIDYFFNADGCESNNDNGRLDTILGSIKKNDYLLIQFGINDSAASKAERYAPTCGKVPGTAGSFEDYMAKYIEGAKAKDATPVLVTTVIGLKSYDSKSKKFVGSYSNCCNAMKQLAAYYNIPCIDLNSLMVAHYNSIGYDAAYKYHMCSTGSTDMTHFTETGAKAIAKLVADEMKKQGLV